MSVDPMTVQPGEQEAVRSAAGSRWSQVARIIAIATSLFHLYTAGFVSLPPMVQRSVHLTLILVLVFLLVPATKKPTRQGPSPFDLLLILASIGVGLHTLSVWEKYALGSFGYDPFDLGMGILAIVLITEAARRTSGWALPILIVLSLAYAVWGYVVPGVFAHPGFVWQRVIYHIYLTSEGIYGLVLGVSATFIALFVLFGSFMKYTGLSEFFNELARTMSGRSHGAPAKMAVFASALMGTITGSTSSNVAATGSITIPLMISSGFPRTFAGAVEATASAGGQIMPPLMGSAAFIMAEFLGIPYLKVAAAATIPAILYFFAVYMYVHFSATRLGIKVKSSDRMALLPLLRAKGQLALPIVLVIGLLLLDFTPLRAAFWGIVSVAVVSFMRKDTRLTLASTGKAMEDGARTLLGLAVACASVGILLGVVSLSGAALSFGHSLVQLAGGNLALMLVLTAIASFILGLELPAVACYILLAIVAAPGLVTLGVDPIAAHLFVFTFGIFSTLTPPVCTGAFTAAAIAKAPPMMTGWLSCMIAFPCYLVPFLFVYRPILILSNFSWGEFLLVVPSVVGGVLMMAAATAGYLIRKTTVLERTLLSVGGIFMIIPQLSSTVLGLAFLAVVLLLQRRRAVPDVAI